MAGAIKQMLLTKESFEKIKRSIKETIAQGVSMMWPDVEGNYAQIEKNRRWLSERRAGVVSVTTTKKFKKRTSKKGRKTKGKALNDKRIQKKCRLGKQMKNGEK